ncbi:copper chaperone CopZ [Ignavibacteriales bacterium]
MESVKITIEGMTCQHCVKAVEVELSELDVNVLGVNIGSAEVRYDSLKVKPKELNEAIENAGYKVIAIENLDK